MWFKWGKKEYPIRNLGPKVSGDHALPTFTEAVGGKDQSAVSTVSHTELGESGDMKLTRIRNMVSKSF